MNGLLLTLLCLIGISLDLTGMESSLSKSTDAEYSAEKKRVPSLKKLILSQLVADLVKQKDGALLEKIKNSCSWALSDCARTLEEDDQRVLLWKIFGSQQKSVRLEHTPVRYEHGRENSIFAAAFTPNNKFLITVTCSCAEEPHYIVYVWRTDDIEVCMKGGAPLPMSQSTNHKIETESAQPVLKEPCSTFDLGRVENYSSGFEIICHPKGGMIIIEVPDEDSYYLRLDEQGILSRLWRLNVLPLAKTLNASEGSDAEKRLIEKSPFNGAGFYRRSHRFNSAGTHLLIYVRDDSAELGDLYCYSLEDLARLRSTPAINGLDDTLKIASSARIATWQSNDRILIFQTKNKNSVIHVINRELHATT